MSRQINKADEEKSNTGSPNSDEPVFLVVGKIHKPHGVSGDLLLEILTDFPERLNIGKELFIGDDYLPVKLSKFCEHPKGAIIHFQGFNTMDDVGVFRNWLVYVKTANLPVLSDGEHYFHQLIGLNVVDETGQRIGELTEILETGANDVYCVISPDGNEILLPAIDSVILKVDIAKRVMVVSLPQWL